MTNKKRKNLNFKSNNSLPGNIKSVVGLAISTAADVLNLKTLQNPWAEFEAVGGLSCMCNGLIKNFTKDNNNENNAEIIYQAILHLSLLPPEYQNSEGGQHNIISDDYANTNLTLSKTGNSRVVVILRDAIERNLSNGCHKLLNNSCIINDNQTITNGGVDKSLVLDDSLSIYNVGMLSTILKLLPILGTFVKYSFFTDFYMLLKFNISNRYLIVMSKG